MEPWIAQLLTLAGVAVGASASFVSTRWLERARWRRDEALRWDAKRLECYAEFASATKQLINTAHRIAASLGLPATGQPLDPTTGLPALAVAEQELSLKWEQILMLGSPDTILAAREWRHVAWHLEWFARGRRDNPEEYTAAAKDSGQARRRFYEAVRADLGIVSGEVPELSWPPAFFQAAD
jgi:hypothetical protein